MSRAGPHRWLFDGWSLFYDRALIQRTTYDPVHRAVLGALRGARVDALLDVGCGTGRLVAALRREHPPARIVGCDFSRGMLGRAAARSPGGAWVQAEAARLPFADESFDALVCTEAFHWFPDPDAALAEFRRVLRPGGVVLVALVTVPFGVVGDLVRVGSELVGAPFHWPTAEALARRFERAGLVVVEQRRIWRLPGAFVLPPVLTRGRRPGPVGPRIDPAGRRSRPGLAWVRASA